MSKKKWIKVEEYKQDDNHTKYIQKVSKHALEIEFDKIFENSSLSKDVNIFVLKPKQAYYNNTFLYCPYINYFIEYYDDDNELLLAYLKLKFMMDRAGNKKYTKEVFLDDLFEYLLSDSMVEKIEKLTEDNYELSLNTKKSFKFKAIEFNNEQGKILLNISMAIKIFIPIVTHYIHVTGIKNNKGTDEFLGKVFYKILHYFEKDNNMYNKLYEFIISKVNRFKHSDKNHWDKVEILGLDIPTETEKVLMRLLVDIFYKYTFAGNIIAMNATSIKNIVQWSLKTNFEKNLRQISDVRDEDGLSDFDKIEMNMSKFDESFVIMGSINVSQTLKTLKKKYNVKFNDNEIQYYIDNLKVNNLQRNIVFNLFGKDFGNIRDMYSMSLTDYVKLIIIMKKMLTSMGYVIIQHILTGIMNINPHMKKMSKKQIVKIENSERLSVIKDKYKSTFDLIYQNTILNTINTIISSNVALVDYEHEDKSFRRINIQNNTDLIIDEYLKLVEMM